MFVVFKKWLPNLHFKISKHILASSSKGLLNTSIFFFPQDFQFSVLEEFLLIFRQTIEIHHIIILSSSLNFFISSQSFLMRIFSCSWAYVLSSISTFLSRNLILATFNLIQCSKNLSQIWLSSLFFRLINQSFSTFLPGDRSKSTKLSVQHCHLLDSTNLESPFLVFLVNFSSHTPTTTLAGSLI